MLLNGCTSTTTHRARTRVYRKLGVREVWLWRRGRLTAHVHRGDAYEAVETSDVLPGLDLSELAQYLDRPTTSQSIRDYRSALEARKR